MPTTYTGDVTLYYAHEALKSLVILHMSNVDVITDKYIIKISLRILSKITIRRFSYVN